jgi:F-type H+-transporting ATPase subunit b
VLNEIFAAEIPLRFESAPELISGIELVSNGQKMAWSIADYLTAMEKGISEVLDGKGDADALPPPDPLLEERRGS